MDTNLWVSEYICKKGLLSSKHFPNRIKVLVFRGYSRRVTNGPSKCPMLFR